LYWSMQKNLKRAPIRITPTRKPELSICLKINLAPKTKKRGPLRNRPTLHCFDFYCTIRKNKLQTPRRILKQYELVKRKHNMGRNSPWEEFGLQAELSQCSVSIKSKKYIL
jgi:hypothetical protein